MEQRRAQPKAETCPLLLWLRQVKHRRVEAIKRWQKWVKSGQVCRSEIRVKTARLCLEAKNNRMAGECDMMR